MEGTSERTSVELRDVDVVIDGARLVRDVSLQVAAGERVALIGPSGAGKTTLLRLVAGVLWPSAGSVTVLGERAGELAGRRLARLRAEVGFLHQSENLVPGLRVAHNVLMGRLGRWSLARSLWSFLVPQELERARAALRRVELEARLWALPGELSGGEQQRVALARLFVQEPRVLLADEPASALDLRLAREVVRLLIELAGEGRATLLVSLHALELLDAGFDRVVALRAGELTWQGAPAELSPELLRELYGAEARHLRFGEDGA